MNKPASGEGACAEACVIEIYSYLPVRLQISTGQRRNSPRAADCLARQVYGAPGGRLDRLRSSTVQRVPLGATEYRLGNHDGFSNITSAQRVNDIFNRQQPGDGYRLAKKAVRHRQYIRPTTRFPRESSRKRG